MKSIIVFSIHSDFLSMINGQEDPWKCCQDVLLCWLYFHFQVGEPVGVILVGGEEALRRVEELAGPEDPDVSWTYFPSLFFISTSCLPFICYFARLSLAGLLVLMRLFLSFLPVSFCVCRFCLLGCVCFFLVISGPESVVCHCVALCAICSMRLVQWYSSGVTVQRIVFIIN